MAGLNAGADDYLAKPFVLAELAARAGHGDLDAVEFFRAGAPPWPMVNYD